MNDESEIKRLERILKSPNESEFELQKPPHYTLPEALDSMNKDEKIPTSVPILEGGIWKLWNEWDTLSPKWKKVCRKLLNLFTEVVKELELEDKGANDDDR